MKHRSEHRTVLNWVLVIMVVVAPSIGRAFYNPEEGRWLSRDPVNEPGVRRIASTRIKGSRNDVNLYAFVKNVPQRFIDPLGLCGYSCGPNIGQAIVEHLNAFISQDQGNLNPLVLIGARGLGRAARVNGPAIRRAAVGIPGCGTGPCSGTFTLCDICISGYHIDHILVMAYIAESYNTREARRVGQLNESILLEIESGGEEFEGSDNAISNADLGFNEVALCIAGKMKHRDANRGVTDLLTVGEVCECTKAVTPAQRAQIAKKPGMGGRGSTGYQDCSPCNRSVPTPSGLTLPPIDL
jgi:RHS repeat-associated protein